MSPGKTQPLTCRKSPARLTLRSVPGNFFVKRMVPSFWVRETAGADPLRNALTFEILTNPRARLYAGLPYPQGLNGSAGIAETPACAGARAQWRPVNASNMHVLRFTAKRTCHGLTIRGATGDAFYSRKASRSA
jgi:hypothetical protein